MMSEPRARYIPLEQSPPQEVKFLAFTADVKIEYALEVYEKRYGQPPDAVYTWKRYIYLGPIEL